MRRRLAVVALRGKELAELVVGADMVFMLETFCGHGFNRDLEDGRCYRGPDADLWFDLSCIHPNPTGHAATAEMFLSVIEGE